ncbi:MAG TPA: alpha/beta hydrolase [Acidimicrobiales bacterium]
MPLDPIIQAIVDNTKAQGRSASIADGTVEEARQGYLMTRAVGGTDPDLATVDDVVAPGPAGDIPLRVYRPADGGAAGGTLPIVVYFHGGGFTIGSIDSHDPITRRIAADTGAIVVSVEYRLAPEHVFPAAVDDAFAALRWVADHATEVGGDPSRIAVAGDSAGGCLATVSALMARDAGGPDLCFQALVYPTADTRMGHASIEENADGPFLTKAAIEWFYRHYQPDVNDWRASPILAPDLSGLPPALIVSAQYDPLRDENEAYAAKLREAGVEATLHRYETMPHMFFQLYGILPVAQECMAEVCAALRGAFAAVRASS